MLMVSARFQILLSRSQLSFHILVSRLLAPLQQAPLDPLQLAPPDPLQLTQQVLPQLDPPPLEQPARDLGQQDPPQLGQQDLLQLVLPDPPQQVQAAPDLLVLSLVVLIPTTTVLEFASAVKVSTNQETTAWLVLLAVLTVKEHLTEVVNAYQVSPTTTVSVLSALLEPSGAQLPRNAYSFAVKTLPTPPQLMPVFVLMDSA